MVESVGLIIVGVVCLFGCGFDIFYKKRQADKAIKSELDSALSGETDVYSTGEDESEEDVEKEVKRRNTPFTLNNCVLWACAIIIGIALFIVGFVPMQ